MDENIIRFNLKDGLSTTPEQARKDQQAAAEFDLPYKTVTLERDKLHLEHDVNLQVDALADAPSAFTLTGESTDWAYQAAGNMEKAAWYERAARQSKEHYASAKGVAESTGIAWEQAWIEQERRGIISRQMRGQGTEADEARLAELELERQPDLYEENIGGWGAGNVPYFMAQMVPQLIESSVSAWDETLAGAAGGVAAGATTGAAVGAVGGLKGALLGARAGASSGARKGAKLGFTLGRMRWMFEQESAGAYEEYSQLTGPDGKVIDQDAAKMAAYIYGTLSSGLEVGFGIDKALGKAVFSPKDALKELMAQRSVYEALKKYGGSIAKNAGVEGITEVAQELLQSGVIQAGLQKLEFGEVDIDTDELKGQAIHGFKAGAYGGGGISATVGLPVLGSDILRAKSAVDQAEGVRKTAEAMREFNEATNPDAGAKLADKVISDIATGDSVFIEPKALGRFFQLTELELDEIQALMPQAQSRYRGALDSGEMVQVPESEFYAHIATSDHYAELESSVAFEPDGPTVGQSQEAIAQMQEVAKEYQKTSQKADNVTSMIYAALQETGIYESKAASRMAALWGAWANTTAKKTGKDPMQVLKESNLLIEAATLEAAPKEGEEAPRSRVDTLLDLMRKDWAPKAEEVKGLTLGQMLAKAGGLADEGGELAARDWGKQTTGKGYLARESGLAMDDAIVKAQEEGYVLPSDDHAGLLAALDREFGGESAPIYSTAFDANAPEVMRKRVTMEQMEALQDELAAAGVTDWRDLSNDEIKQALGYGVFNQDATAGEVAADAADAAYRPDKDLAVVHNLSAENLMHAVELGGLAAPSLAVTRVSQGDFGGYGEISLVADPSILNTPKVRTFNADVYSPRHPRAEYRIDEMAWQDIRKKVRQDADEAGGFDLPDAQSPDDFVRNDALKYHWLKQQGKAPAIKKQKVDPWMRKALALGGDGHALKSSEAFARIVKSELNKSLKLLEEEIPEKAERFRGLWFDEEGNPSFNKIREYADKVVVHQRDGGVDRYAMRAAINKKMEVKKTREAFEEYARELFYSLVEEKVMRAGETRSGAPKYKAYTLDNIVAEMVKGLKAAEGFMYGAGTVRSSVAKEYKNLGQIAADREKIVSSDEAKAVKEEASAKLDEALDALKPFYKYDAEGWGYRDDAASAIVEGAKGQREAFNLDAESRAIIKDLLDYLRELPTEYFEAKAQRAVGLDEFAVALVPKGTPAKVTKALADAGLQVRRYDSKQKGARADMVQKQHKLLFQEAKGSLEVMQSGPEKIFRITLTPGQADLSTFLHESSHFWFESMNLLQHQSAEIADDLSKVMAWLGLDSFDQVENKHHEKFARAFEAYLYEGKAPSVELRDTFSRIKLWMKQIYKSISNLLRIENVEMSDDIRNVFDRLLATDEQIAEARTEDQWIGFENQEASGLDDAQWAAYQAQWAKAEQAAENAIDQEALSAARREARAARSARGKAIQAEVDDAATEALRNGIPGPARGAAAKHLIRTGKYPNDPEGKMTTPLDGLGVDKRKIDGAELRDRPQAERNKLLGITKNGGSTAEYLAEALGFDTREDLLQEMLNAPGYAQWKKDEAKRRLNEEFPETAIESNAAELAADAMHNDATAKALHVELRATSKKVENPAGKFTAPLDTIRNTAREMSEGTELRFLVPSKYLQAERKAAREWQQAMAKGDHGTAKAAKHQQLLNHYLYSYAMKAQQRAEKLQQRLKHFQKKKVREQIGKAGAHYVRLIDAITENLDLKKRSGSELDARDALAKFIADVAREERDTVITPDMLDDATYKSWRDLSLVELEEEVNYANHIAKMARRKRNLLKLKGDRTIAQLVELSRDATANLKSMSQDEVVMRNLTGETKWNDRALSKFRDFKASLKVVEFMARRLDGDQMNGPVYEALFHPFREAQTEDFEMLKAVTKELQPHLDQLADPKFNEKVKVGNQVLPKRAVYMMALNMGNEGNRYKLVTGSQQLPDGGWTEADVIQAIDQHLTPDEIRTLQKVWDIIDGLGPQLFDVMENVTGIRPPKVEAEAITLGGVSLRGGYFPVIYEPSASKFIEAKAETESANKMFEHGLASPGSSMATGMTKERKAAAAYPVKLDAGALLDHVRETVHTITHYEAVDTAYQLIKHPEFRKLVEEKISPEAYKQLEPWLKNIATDGNRPSELKGIDAFLRSLRTGTSVAAMGLSLSTVMMQTMGIFGTIAETRQHTLSGIARTMRDIRSNNYDFIRENSNEWRHTMSTKTDELKAISDNLQYAHGEKWPTYRLKAAQWAFVPMGIVTKAMNSIAWYAGLAKAEAEGWDGKKAYAYADQVLRQSQSMAGSKDQAAVQFASSEGFKILNMFYTFFGTLYNQLARTGQIKANKEGFNAWMHAGAHVVAWAIIPVYIEQLMREGLPGDEEEDEEWFQDASWWLGGPMQYAAVSVPYLRQATDFAFGEYGFQLSPVAGQAEKALRLLKYDYYDDEEVWEKVAKSTATAATLATGAPIDKPVNYILRVMKAEEEGADFNEAWRHVMFGAPLD